jgi:hypothetical protein
MTIAEATEGRQQEDEGQEDVVAFRLRMFLLFIFLFFDSTAMGARLQRVVRPGRKWRP